MTNEVLADLAARAFFKSPWHSLMAALDGVTDEAFIALPPRYNGFPWMDGSIRDIVYHVAGDKLVQLDHAFGDGTMDWENVPVHKSDREAMLAQLRDSQKQLLEAIRRTRNLEERVAGWGGKRLKASDFFLMLIEHDLYHAGQVRYIRNLLE